MSIRLLLQTYFFIFLSRLRYNFTLFFLLNKIFYFIMQSIKPVKCWFNLRFEPNQSKEENKNKIISSLQIIG